MTLIRRFAAVLAVFAWAYCGAAFSAATLDHAVCSAADKAGGNPALCEGQELIDSATQEVAKAQNMGIYNLISVAGSNDITACSTPSITALDPDLKATIKPAANNSGPVRLNWCGLGLKPVVSASGLALASGDLQSSSIYTLKYYAANDEYRVLSVLGTGVAPASGPFITFGNTTSLSAERAITPGTGITATDGGVNSTYTLGITTNGVTDSLIRQGAATSIIGRSAGSTGNVADIAASADGQYLARKAGAIAWGLPPASDIVNTPAGNVAATNAQTAINELDSEKSGLALANTFTARQAMTVDDALTNSVQTLLDLTHTSSGTVTTGFGTRLSFNAENASGVTKSVMGTIDTVWTNATAGSEVSKIVFGDYNAGAGQVVMSMGNGLYSVGATGGDMGLNTANFSSYFVNGTNLTSLYQPLDTDLTAYAANSTTGLWAYTGAGTGAARTLTAPAAGFTITNPAGTAGNPTFALTNDLNALEGLAGTGIGVRSAADTWVQRVLTAPAAGMTITNSDGVAGNPTFAFVNDLGTLEALAGTGIAVRTGTDAWAQRLIAGTANEITITNGDGVAGNITASLPAAITATGKTITGGTFSGPTIAGTGVTMNGSTSGATTLAASAVASGALTLPAATDTLVGRNTVDTLANKTLTSPTITGGALNGTLGATTPGTVVATTISASGQITSTLVTGTAPFSVASTTNVPNLNASSLNGATFAAPGAIGGTTPGAITGTTITANTGFSGPHNGSVGATTPSTVAGTTVSATGQITSTLATGTAPLVIASTTQVPNLYVARSALADTVTTNANLTGDVTSVGNAATIAANAVTNAKAAQMAAHTIKANITAGSASAVDSSLSAILDAEAGSTQGLFLVRKGTGWSTIGPGTINQVPTSQGAGADPIMATPAGGGGGGTPGGTNGQIQYNNAGAFGGLTNAAVLSQIGGEGTFTTTAGITAAGTTQGTATTITATSDFQNLEVTTVVTASANGIVLPTSTAAMRFNIINRGAGILKIYPASTGTINGGTASAPITVAPKNAVQITAKDASNNWYSAGRVLEPLPAVIKTSGTSWTSDANSAYARVTVVGGGGAGGTAAAATASGSGGGYAGIAQKLYTTLPSTSYTYAVGAAGASSTFTDGTTLITGNAGSAGAAGVATSAKAGGAGGTGTNGDINITGSPGSTGLGASAPANYGGNGASGLFGSGGIAPAGAGGAGGNAAGPYGAGGAGGVGNSGTGGNASPGAVIIEEFVWR